MCKSCEASRETLGHWRTYDSPKCLWCTVRLWQQIGKLRTPSSEAIAARRAVVEADAIAYGHTKAEMKAIASLKELALQPVEGGKKK